MSLENNFPLIDRCADEWKNKSSADENGGKSSGSEANNKNATSACLNKSLPLQLRIAFSFVCIDWAQLDTHWVKNSLFKSNLSINFFLTSFPIENLMLFALALNYKVKVFFRQWHAPKYNFK